MDANCHILSLPKAGRNAYEYEDAFYPFGDRSHPLADGWRCAIADGATESSFARRWARQLVLTYCNPSTPTPSDVEGFRRAIEKQGSIWWRHVFAKPLAWNFLVKAQRGAFATLTGISFAAHIQGIGRWEAVAIGDSCLFQVRNADLIRSWPEMRANEFGFDPLLLCSVPTSNTPVWTELEQYITCGEWIAGDVFLLMTDALAKWFVIELEDGNHPWRTLVEMSASEEIFAEWIGERRTNREIHNDDVTLVLVTIEESS